MSVNKPYRISTTKSAATGVDQRRKERRSKNGRARERRERGGRRNGSRIDDPPDFPAPVSQSQARQESK